MLDDILSPKDIKALNEEELNLLAAEIRDRLISVVSRQGGHLASNLGVVELTIALHYAFDAPNDKIIFDVGHQAYVHKLLTGRVGEFERLRKSGGLSGFPRISESEYDAYCVGHASTAISAALGMARANAILGSSARAIAVVGDGALTGGMCYEALNDAGASGLPLIVVLNDNEMSISKNVGALSGYLTSLRQSRVYRGVKRGVRDSLLRIPFIGAGLEKLFKWFRNTVRSIFVDGEFFEALGLDYYGPIDGHDIKRLVKTFEMAKKAQKPVLLHVVTHKGRGYAPAESHPDQFHGVAPFYVEPSGFGEAASGKLAAGELVLMAKDDPGICVITAAMPSGTGMTAFRDAYPKRFFDVGIAEEHAVAMASGMALSGAKPYVCIYSTFLQRAYDQIMMDACMNGANVTFLLDRAGLTGEDGETHQGIFDLTYLRSMPGLAIAAPRDARTLRELIRLSARINSPMAIRYSKEAGDGMWETDAEVRFGVWERLREGDAVTILAVGRMVAIAMSAAVLLRERGFSCEVFDARFIKPLDETALDSIGERLIVTMEDNTVSGGFGSAVAERFAAKGLRRDIMLIGEPDAFVRQASVAEQMEEMGLMPAQVAERIAVRLGA